MSKQVKGSLFVEYVRMIKKNKQIDWNKHLASSEMRFLNQVILPSEWYPFEIYQHYGAAIFQEIADGEPPVACSWGKATMDRLAELYKGNLIEKGQPLGSLMKFKELNQRLFNFDSFEIIVHDEKHVDIGVDPAFGTGAVEGYSYQMLGSFRRLIELSGVDKVEAEFSAKTWEGDHKTVIELRW